MVRPLAKVHQLVVTREVLVAHFHGFQLGLKVLNEVGPHSGVTQNVGLLDGLGPSGPSFDGTCRDGSTTQLGPTHFELVWASMFQDVPTAAWGRHYLELGWVRQRGRLDSFSLCFRKRKYIYVTNYLRKNRKSFY